MYEVNFELKNQSIDVNLELQQNSINADLILNVLPDKTSQLINDSGYITIADVPTKLSELVNDTGFITASALIPLENDIVEIESDILGLQNSKVDKITGKGLSSNDFTNAFKTKLEGIEAGAEVNTVNSVNGMTGDVVIEVPDSATWGNITGTLSNQTDLQTALNGKQPTISDLEAIRTGAGKGATALQPNDNITQLVNNAGYITSSALAPYALSADLANVATSGSYNDLSDKPTIPSEVTESTVSGWGFTKNTGTVTSVNNVQPVNGNVTLPSAEYTAGTGLQLSDQNEFDIMQEDEKESSIIKIGNPVEVENLVYTSFSTSNYLKVSNQIQIGASDTFEIAIKFKQSNTQNGSIVFCGGSDSSNYIQIYLGRLSNQYIYSLQSFGTIGRMRNDITSLNSITQSINTYIWLRIRRASLTMYFDYSVDGSTWVNMGSQQIYSSTLGTSLFNFYLGNGADISNYPCTVATIDLNDCYIKVNDVTIWDGSGIISRSVARATNNLYGLVKPDSTSITVNDGVISANIANSVDSSSTNNQAVGAKLFYDTVGNIETILASI